jgi:phospholipid/cholesterol/gamma-HCH transport system substrate-binding protein
MKSRIYIRVSLLFIASVIIIFWGLNFLKGKNLLSRERSFYSVYDKIGGLTRSSPVTINGFQIGQVRDIELSATNPERIEVRFTISYQSINIPRGSVARIYSVDIMGTKGIALDFSKNPELLNRNDTLPGAIEGDLRDQVNAQMLPLRIKAEELMASMDSVLAGLQMVLNQSNRENLSASFSGVNQTLENLRSASGFLNDYVRQESEKISAVLSKLDTMSTGLTQETASVRHFITNMARVSDTLSQIRLNEALASFQEALGGIRDITNRISNGEGTLGKLVVSDSLYTALLATNGSLNRLIEDIRLHPDRYVRLSLKDKSTNVYATNDSELAKAMAGQGTSDYYVCLFQSPAPMAPDDPELQGLGAMDYIQVGSLYYYFVYHSARIEPCQRKLTRLRSDHPSAAIYTWVNGKWTRLAI